MPSSSSSSSSSSSTLKQQPPPPQRSRSKSEVSSHAATTLGALRARMEPISDAIVATLAQLRVAMAQITQTSVECSVLHMQIVQTYTNDVNDCAKGAAQLLQSMEQLTGSFATLDTLRSELRDVHLTIDELERKLATAAIR